MIEWQQLLIFIHHISHVASEKKVLVIRRIYLLDIAMARQTAENFSSKCSSNSILFYLLEEM